MGQQQLWGQDGKQWVGSSSVLAGKLCISGHNSISSEGTQRGLLFIDFVCGVCVVTWVSVRAHA